MRLIPQLAALAVFVSAAWGASAPSTTVGDAPEKAPGLRALGKVYTWTAANGMKYEYFVPKSYDPEAGANLTFILHGSNLDRRWGFANHAAGKFRADDIVVSPDGTTSNGRGGFNSLQKGEDLERLHALHVELKATFQVRSTYLYGHSQGSFFAFLYAGAYPEEVQGVVGHASGVWIGTRGGGKHHHQAIVLMHGTADPVVPYGQSVGSLSAHFEKLKYPLARLRSLDGWNHWPSEHHASQQLAWCEGMTSDDPVRVAAAWKTLSAVKEALDPVAFRQVAERVLTLDGMEKKVQSSAEKAIEAVDKAAAAHVTAIEKSRGKNKACKLEGKPWVGHVPLFLRHFRGTPACEDFEQRWSKVLARHDKLGAPLAKDYWKTYKTDPGDAFNAGIELVEKAFFRRGTDDPRILNQLDAWADEAKALKLKKSQMKAYQATVPSFRAGLEKGEKAFEKLSRRFH